MRSVVQWYGGKGNMIAKLMRHVPGGGRPYCEPYMGGASLFFARKPAPVEVLNDLNSDLVNLFRCLQDPKTFPELAHRIRYTLYSRAEFGRALEILNSNQNDPVLRAWAMFVAVNQAMSGKYETIGNWSRSIFSSNNGTSNKNNKWIMRLTMLEDWHKRLLMVQIENRDALEVIRYYDNPEAVFYLDPPYHHETRAEINVYEIEQGHDHHVDLVRTILECKGAVVLSGYEHPVYEPLVEHGWSLVKYETSAFVAGRIRGSGLQGTGAAKAKVPRIECVWSNPRAQEMLKRQTGQVSIFEITT